MQKKMSFTIYFLYFCTVKNKGVNIVCEQLRLDNQLCFRLYTAARLITGVYHPYLGPLGLTYPQYLVMLVLWEDDCQPVCDIARKLMLDTNTVTPLLQRMEKSGLLTRAKSGGDARQRIVSLTAKGASMMEKAAHIPECLGSEIIRRTGCGDDLLKMIQTLDKLIDGLKQIKQ